MRNLLLIFCVLITGVVYGQRFPYEFTEETVIDSSNFEVYSQKGGAPRRANLFNLKKYFDQEIYITNDTTLCLTRADGDTCVSLGLFLQELSIDGDSLRLTDGSAIAISDIDTNTDDQVISFNPANDSLTLEDGGSVYLGGYTQSFDSISITGDTMYFYLSGLGGTAAKVNVADFLAGASDGNGIKDPTSGLPASNQSIDANSNSLLIDSMTTFRSMAANHILTNGVSAGVASLAANRLSSVHNGFIHQNGLGTYAHYTNGTNSALLKLFADQAEVGISDQNAGVSGFKTFWTDSYIQSAYANAGGVIENSWVVTDSSFAVKGPIGGVNNSNYLLFNYPDSTLQLFGKYYLPNTTPAAESVIVVDGSGNASWAQSNAISYDDLTSGSVAVSIKREGGTATTLTNPSGGTYDLDIKSGSEPDKIDVYVSTPSGTLTGSNEFILTIDNSANSRDKRYTIQIYSASSDALADYTVTGTTPTQTVAGNVTTITIPNANGFASGFRMLLR